MTQPTPRLIKGEVAKRRDARKRRNNDILLQYQSAIAGGSSSEDATAAICQRYGISRSTLYYIRRSAKEGGNA